MGFSVAGSYPNDGGRVGGRHRRHARSRRREAGTHRRPRDGAPGRSDGEDLCARRVGGPGRDRTGDLVNAIHARSQLRYRPTPEESKVSSRRGRRSTSARLDVLPRRRLAAAVRATPPGGLRDPRRTVRPALRFRRPERPLDPGRKGPAGSSDSSPDDDAGRPRVAGGPPRGARARRHGSLSCGEVS
jgi:hypothetical protein